MKYVEIINKVINDFNLDKEETKITRIDICGYAENSLTNVTILYGREGSWKLKFYIKNGEVEITSNRRWKIV